MNAFDTKMKYLYVVNYWVPFPVSEYGGIVLVVAESPEECHDILLDWRPECNSSYDSKIMVEVNNAQIFELSSDKFIQESGVVNEFTT